MKKSYRLTGIKRFDFAISSLDNHLIISGKSHATRRNYNRVLYKFIINANKLPDECTKNEIINTIIKIQNINGFKSATLKIYIYAIKYYLKNIAERMDLFTKIPTPQIKKYDVEILNIDEVNLLFKSCKNSRDLLITQLLYETGIRIKELLNIKFQDFDLHNKSLTIRNGKNRKTRTVYFGVNLINTLKVYHNSNRSLFYDSPNDKQFHPFFNLSRSGIRHILKSIIKRSGIKKRVTPHLLRHAFAVHYLNFGGTIYQLQKLLGHSHLTTTFYYLQYAVLPDNKNISILDKLIETKDRNIFNLTKT